MIVSFGIDCIDPLKFDKILDTDPVLNKPMVGGLWGSTITWYSDIKSAWSDFVEENMGIIFNRINSLKKVLHIILKKQLESLK